MLRVDLITSDEVLGLFRFKGAVGVGKIEEQTIKLFQTP